VSLLRDIICICVGWSSQPRSHTETLFYSLVFCLFIGPVSQLPNYAQGSSEPDDRAAPLLHTAVSRWPTFQWPSGKRIDWNWLRAAVFQLNIGEIRQRRGIDIGSIRLKPSSSATLRSS